MRKKHANYQLCKGENELDHIPTHRLIEELQARTDRCVIVTIHYTNKRIDGKNQISTQVFSDPPTPVVAITVLEAAIEIIKGTHKKES